MLIGRRHRQSRHLTLSFILTAITCGFAALCYAELASMIPIAGSAYTYAYTTLGEVFAWIIGWDLILEYAVSNMSVAVGFSAYFNVMCDYLFGGHLPKYLSEPAFMGGIRTGSLFNIPALLIVMLLSWMLVRGVKESAGANNIMVAIKVSRRSDIRFRRRPCRSGQQSASLPAATGSGCCYRSRDRLLHLHWLRFRFNRRGRMQEPAAQYADRHHRHADHLRYSVYVCCVRTDRHRQLENAGQRRARRERAYRPSAWTGCDLP